MAEREPGWDEISPAEAMGWGEVDWDTEMEMEAESRRDWGEVTDAPVNSGMFHCPSCGAMPGEPHREPRPF